MAWLLLTLLSVALIGGGIALLMSARPRITRNRRRSP